MTFLPFTTGDSERRVVFAYPNFGVASQPSPSSFSFGPQPGSSQFPQHTAQGPFSGNSTCFPFPPQTSPLLFSSSPSNSTPNTLGYTSTSSFGPVFGSSVTSSSPASVFPSFSSTTSAAPAFGSGSNEPGFGKSSFSFGCGADNTHSYPSLEKISDNSGYGQKPAFGFNFSPSLQTNNSVNNDSLFRRDDEKPTLANQHRGSRITPYAVTEMINERPAKMASICGMPVYGAKSHEELRWEDYQPRTEVGCAIDGGSTHPWFGMTKGSTSDKSGFFTSNMSITPTWGSNWGVSQPLPLHIGSSADSASVDPLGKKPITIFSFPIPSQANTSGGNGAGSLNWKPNPPFPSPSNVQTPTCPSPFPFNAPNGPHIPPSWPPLPSSSPSAPLNHSTFSEQQPTVKVCPKCHSSLTSEYAFAYPFTQPNSTAAMPDPSANVNYTSTFLSKEPSQSAQTESTNPAAVESHATADNIVAVKDPFGAQPSKQLSTSSTQFGISSMSATHIPLLIKTSSLHTPRHISQRRGTLRLSIQQQRSDQEKVPFFVHENDPEGIRVPQNHLAPRRDPKSAFMNNSEPTAESSTGITFDLNLESTDPSSKMVSKATAGVNGAPISSTNLNTRKLDEEIENLAAGEFHITLEEEPMPPKLTRRGYYTDPPISYLQAMETSQPGYCARVRGFAIGRHGFGKIEFEGETDVASLDLDSTVEFNTREVVVYPDPMRKPPAGEGPNRAAVVTLMEIRCENKKTGKVHVEGEAVEKYVGMLKRAGEKQGAEFVSYDAPKGEWKFRVEHF